MRAVVLGATGHIGAHVVRALLAEGHQVRAAYRTERYLTVLDSLPVERVRVDVETLEGLREALDGCAWVFHVAGYYPSFRDRRDQALTRGITSTRRLLEQIRQVRPDRVVFTSSAATIRRIPGRAVTEAGTAAAGGGRRGNPEDAVRGATEEDAEPWSPHLSSAHGTDIPPSAKRQVGGRPLYAAVKIAMEQEVLRASQAGLPVVIVNPSLCLGEYDAHPFSGRAILAFAKHRVPVYVEHRFNAVYTGDVGVGHVRAAERGRLGERYLLTCRNLTLKAFADLVAASAGVPPPRWRIPYGVALTAAWLSEAVAWMASREPLLPRQTVHAARLGQRLDGSKALRELSLPQTPIEEAIRRSLAWFRAHGYL